MEKRLRHTIFELNSAMEKSKKKSIVEELKNILSVKKRKFKILSFREKANDQNAIQIGTYLNEKTKDLNNEFIIDVPANFVYPIYFFTAFTYSNDSRPICTTPYGAMPEKAIGANGSGYLFSNIYYFNDEGEAVKHELIVGDLPSDMPEPRSLKVNFIPSEADSRYVPLSEKDYIKIKAGLRLINNGTYVPTKANFR